METHATCQYCEKPADQQRRILERFSICKECFARLVRNRYFARDANGKYFPTEHCLDMYPGMRVVSHCPRDGIATCAKCPNCLGREDEITTVRLPHPGYEDLQ
jgi:hypothetical protein